MLPLNYAVLKVFDNESEALCAQDVMNRLYDQYKNFRTFKKSFINEALMSCKENGLLDEDRFDLDDEKNVRIFYKINEEGANAIVKYNLNW